MDNLHHLPSSFNCPDQSQPTFVAATDHICRRVQGGPKICSALELALRSGSAAVAWRLEARREEG